MVVKTKTGCALVKCKSTLCSCKNSLIREPIKTVLILLIKGILIFLNVKLEIILSKSNSIPIKRPFPLIDLIYFGYFSFNLLRALKVFSDFNFT